MENNIINLFKNNKTIQNILKQTKGLEYSLFCNGITTNISALLSASIFNNNNFMFIICNDAFHANKMYESITDIIGYEQCNLYIIDDFIATETIVVSNELKQERLNTLKNIYNNVPKIIITHVSAVLKPIVSYNIFLDYQITINVGDEIDISKFTKKLLRYGYKRVSTTYNIGEFSIRGEVIDVFPSCMEKPIRINVEFDEIVMIKYFDLETQLTMNEQMDKLDIFTLNEINCDDLESLENKLLKIEDSDFIKKDFNDVKEVGIFDKLNKYIKYVDSEYGSIFNYIKDNKYICMFNDINAIKDSYDISINEINQFKYEHSKLSKVDTLYMLPFDELTKNSKKNIYMSSHKHALPLLELHNIYEIDGYKVTEYNNDIKMCISDLKDNKDIFFITFKDDKRLDMFKETLDTNNIDYDILQNFFNVGNKLINLIVCTNAICYGIFSKYKVITEDEIYNHHNKKTKYRSVKENTIVINSKDDLNVGDYVVHYDYGIAKYLGIKTVELNEVKNDYLQLQYENIVLLIPMEKISELEKYIGSEGSIPKLTKIGTNEWEKRKKVVREQLEIIAKDIIELQIKRENVHGYKYKSDSEFQKLFENDFEFDETKDQIEIVNNIKDEMEKGVLIDRLICGDVGFGKTEIAMRAAFKTVYEGKQVVYMAPTTILTRQHYYTFKERFEKYGIKVALLNRMVPNLLQDKIIKELKEGSIDIVIGTHRLLNSEIKYKDLGLLIIDEEQRFGVVHKEKIKRMKENVNVLTLTATPIPRTLQMAVTGIRSLSLLQTPPKNRYPIQTYVLEYNDKIIKEAIYRELSRKGQVFYLHNRISDINVVAKKIKKLVPEAKICVGHGKMNREELEDVVSNFIDGIYNVFICTTIIETGIDIPNSNTLIIEDADKLGLAQLYQIRGRVGRSNCIAYAYFTYSIDKILSKPGEKRLSAIKEFCKIGSGYKIAVRDLAIRGAGDILGKEQSGFINSIGIDMYMKLLNEAVNKVKGIEVKEKPNYKIEISKHIEREYVDDDTIIIYIHKMINQISTKDEKKKVVDELTDRFGKLSQNIMDYIEERYLESQLRKIEVEKIIEMPNCVTLIIPVEVSKKLKGDIVLMTGYKLSERFSFEYHSGQIFVKINKKILDRSWLYLMNNFLERIV